MMIRFSLLLTLMGLAACSAPNEDLQQWMQNTRNEAKTKVKKPELPELPPPATYQAPATSGMNAFNSSRLRMGMQGANAPDLNRPKEVLENFSLENLRYVGSLSSSGKPTSAYISADNHVYTVKTGNYLGQNYGRISAIEADKLVITELVEDTYGNWTNRRVELPLNTPRQSDSTQN